jgi:hypothetical protein
MRTSEHEMRPPTAVFSLAAGPHDALMVHISTVARNLYAKTHASSHDKKKTTTVKAAANEKKADSLSAYLDQPQHEAHCR